MYIGVLVTGILGEMLIFSPIYQYPNNQSTKIKGEKSFKLYALSFTLKYGRDKKIKNS